MNSYGWCPLSSTPNGEVLCGCKGDQCAWFNSEDRNCILFSINRKLGDLETNVRNIEEKID